MDRRVVYRYSVNFKHHVVNELESGRFSSINEAKEHFGIRGDYTIQRWLHKYGRNHLCAKVVRVETADEKGQIRELKKQVKQLREALGYTQAEKVLGDAFLELACERLGEDVGEFKKKVDMLESIKHVNQKKRR